MGVSRLPQIRQRLAGEEEGATGVDGMHQIVLFTCRLPNRRQTDCRGVVDENVNSTKFGNYLTDRIINVTFLP